MENTGIRLTGLWKEKTKAGDTYLTGSLNQGSRFFIMPNKHKKGDKDPDYNMFLKQNEPKKAGNTQAQGNTGEDL